MSKKYQETGLNRNFANSFTRLESWIENPWRRYSFFLILFLGGFFVGKSIGMISAAEQYWDTTGAFLMVFFIEILVRLRRSFSRKKKSYFALQIIDLLRIGLTFGLFTEGFKLL